MLKQSLVKPCAIPGFRITISFTLFYLLIIVIIPLSGLFYKTATLSFVNLWQQLTSSRVIAALWLTFNASLIAATINLFFGTIVSWVLVRYEFRGRNVVDSIVDLPFALPTAVAGIALASIYSPNGIIGQLFKPFGIKIAYTPIGIVIALILVGLPFVVRSVQPILADLAKDQEEAAGTLGAAPWRIFIKIILPGITPAMLTGFALAFARALGEYGSVIFIAGNIPKVSEVVSLLIMIKLEQFDYAGASAIACLMLALSFAILMIINMLQKWSSQRVDLK